MALRCAGFNNVTLKACGHHEIKVLRLPVYSPHAVAEHGLQPTRPFSHPTFH
ncbi:MAG: hypothetical protein AAF519_03830 [Bacteroidota bacterium]